MSHLNALGDNDVPPDDVSRAQAVFERAARLARALMDSADANVCVVDPDRVWRFADGVPVESGAPGSRMVVATGELLWVEDVTLDERFTALSTLKTYPGMRSIVGAPIRLQDGSIPAVIWALDSRPRPYDAEKAAQMMDLADLVADEWHRGRAELALDASVKAREQAQSTLLGLIEASPLSLALTDRDLRVVAASPRWLSSQAVTKDGLFGQHLDDVLPGREQWRRLLEGEGFRTERLKLLNDQGDLRSVQAEVSPWLDAGGRPGGLILTTHDITDMVEALERSERSEELLKLALKIAEIHVWEVDYVRQQLVKIGDESLFFDRPTTYRDITDGMWHLVDARDRDQAKTTWTAHMADGAFEGEYRLARDDGKEVWGSAAVRQITDEAGAPTRFVVALQNVTARKAVEHALVQAKEDAEAAAAAKSAFLATMSHEIRTPLNGVLGMAQAMAMEDLSPEQRQRLDVIRQSGEALLAILNDVLDLSKIEAGKVEIERAAFDIGELAYGAHATFAATAQAQGLAFDLDIKPSARGTWMGDAGRLRQILYNLVSNALKFTEDGGVQVTVAKIGGKLRLTVKDTGIGMSPDSLSRLFQKFEQADVSTTRRYGGTGLGLAICRDLTALMGGEIKAQSQLGKGATFTVDLPMERVARAPTARRPSAPHPLMNPAAVRVLAAEDNAMNQLVLKTLLKQIGITPVIAVDGRAALAAWEAEPWDMILMDVQMPEMDGPTATAEIRKREAAEGRARTPIIALTANAMEHQMAEYRQAGMDGFVAKPIEASRLYEAVQAAVDGSLIAAEDPDIAEDAIEAA